MAKVLFVAALFAFSSAGLAQQLQVCGAAAGDDQPQTDFYSVTSSTSEIEFEYFMFNVVPDRMIVSFEGQELLDTGCVTGGDTLTLTLPGGATSGVVKVEVLPGRLLNGQFNCDVGAPGTLWNYELSAESCEEVAGPEARPGIPVPTLGFWGLMMLALLVLGLALTRMRFSA